MRRILNSFLQFIENDVSESIIVAATNNRAMLDTALFRRFDDVLHYDLPTMDEVKRIVTIMVSGFDPSFKLSDEAAVELSALCQADITRICEEAVKETLLSECKLSDNLFMGLCKERLDGYTARKAG